ncbi:MAG: 1,4-alpha-glucan branching protein domain-containing protein [Candidatus Thorarchaeota archaeon]
MTENSLGSFCLVLHSHLPWVLGHGVWPHGTSWLNEAAAETYIPLLQELYKLMDDGYHPKLTIGLTPVLCEMLRHPTFIEEFTSYLDEKIAAALHDYDDFMDNKYEEGRIKLTRWWEKFYEQIRDDYIHRFNRDIVGAFKKLQDEDLLDIITCGATHGYTPLLSKETSIDAQFKTAVDNYKHHFGRVPTGVWLPECAYRPGYRWKNPLNQEEEYDRPGIEYFLAKNGLKYFFIDTALLLGGKSQGVYAARFPLLKELWKQFADQYEELPISFEKSQYEVYLVSTQSAEAPVGFFTRDEKSGIVVWSGEHGYPGCAEYLDFHKKHYPGGLKYWKVTEAKLDLGKKMLYWPDDVPRKLDENASHYLHLVKDILRDHKNKFGNPGIVVAPYDCELFGHWWFEGNWWVARVLRWMEDDPEIDLTNTRIYVEKNPPNKVCQIIEGSWGQGSSHWVWLNEWTTWSWEKIYQCETKSEEIIAKYKDSADMHLLKILKQMARELLLLESSDWQFLITTWSARDYAENRVALHYENFNRLYEMASKYGSGKHVDEGEWHLLGMLETNNGIFMDLDLEPFAKK